MAEPYIAFSREAEEARRRALDFRNRQSFKETRDPLKERMAEGARLRHMQSDLSRANIQSRADAGHFAKGDHGGINADFTARVKASVDEQRAANPIPSSSGLSAADKAAEFYSAQDQRRLGVDTDQFAGMVDMRNTPSAAIGAMNGRDWAMAEMARREAAIRAERPIRELADKAFNAEIDLAPPEAGIPKYATRSEESAAGVIGNANDARNRVLASIGAKPASPSMAEPMPRLPHEVSEEEKLRMAHMREQNLAGGKYGAADLIKYDAEKQADKDRIEKSKDLDVQAKETQIRAARIAAGLEATPDLERPKRGQVIADASGKAAAENLLGTLTAGTSPLANPDWGKANSNLAIIESLPPEDAAIAAQEALARLRQEGISEQSGSYYGRNAEYARIIGRLRELAGEAASPPPAAAAPQAPAAAPSNDSARVQVRPLRW